MSGLVAFQMALEFITLVGVAGAWSLPLRAEQLTPVIGFLNGSSADGYAPIVAAVGQGLLVRLRLYDDHQPQRAQAIAIHTLTAC